MTIPRILHLVWVGGPRPDWVCASHERWIQHVNSDPNGGGWQIRLHLDYPVPTSEAVDAGLRIGQKFGVIPSAQSDIIRSRAMFEEGGVYVDTDTMPIRQFDESLLAGGPWVGQPPEEVSAKSICTAGLGFPPRHRFFTEVLANAAANLSRRPPVTNGQFLAGPRAYAKVLPPFLELPLDDPELIRRPPVYALPQRSAELTRAVRGEGPVPLENLRQRYPSPLTAFIHASPGRAGQPGVPSYR